MKCLFLMEQSSAIAGTHLVVFELGLNQLNELWPTHEQESGCYRHLGKVVIPMNKSIDLALAL